MPWVPELFSAPVLARLDDESWRENHLAVAYFAGLKAGETDALIRSFANEPELHHSGDRPDRVKRPIFTE